MKKYWSTEKLQEFWKLLPEEKELLGYKSGSKKFLYLLILKHYSIDYTFPTQINDIPKQMLSFGLKQYSITVTEDEITKFLNNYHNYIRYQNEIRSFHGVSQLGHRNQDQLSNFQSPIFKAFIELGRAVKSIFLCRYLSSLELRQEIHSGLNIVENWNSVNDFIFYGKKSEINSNSRDEQEYSMLCLHLLQVCITYINILLVQDIITPELWCQDFTDEDRRGLTPLFNGHINPYGTFELDMAKRLFLREAA